LPVWLATKLSAETTAPGTVAREVPEP